MTEIEKAREALKERRAWSDDYIADFERVIDAKLAEHADRIRAIAREEIEAHEERLMHEAMHGEINRGRECDETGTLTEEGGDRNQLDRRPDREDNSPPAVEAPAAGDSIGGELSDMTALARRLAEALDEVVDNYSVPFGVYDQIDSALAEARKHKLIE